MKRKPAPDERKIKYKIYYDFGMVMRVKEWIDELGMECATFDLDQRNKFFKLEDMLNEVFEEKRGV